MIRIKQPKKGNWLLLVGKQNYLSLVFFLDINGFRRKSSYQSHKQSS